MIISIKLIRIYLNIDQSSQQKKDYLNLLYLYRASIHILNSSIKVFEFELMRGSFY